MSIRMTEPSEEEILRRAFFLWEKAGSPEGRDDEFYHQAQRELRREAQGLEPGSHE
jgi:hypothetical protein